MLGFVFQNYYSACIITFVLIFQSIISYGQQSVIEDLQNQLKEASVNSEKIKLLNELSLKVAYSDKDESLKYAKSALKLANESDDRQGKAIAQIRIGTFFKSISSYDSAFSYYQEALDFGQSNRDYLVELQALAHIGAVNRSKSNYTDALKYLNASSEIAQEQKIYTGKHLH